MQHCLLHLWSLYDEEKRTRLHDNVEYAEKNYRLVLENRDLEKKNLELHKEIGNTLEMSQKASSHELELQKAKRQKAEQQVMTLKETMKEESRKMEQQLGTLKQEKRKLEFYIAELLKAGEVAKNKLKKISEILEE